VSTLRMRDGTIVYTLAFKHGVNIIPEVTGFD
jgi:hypothetical protein